MFYRNAKRKLFFVDCVYYIAFPLFLHRLTIVLCKELSTFSKEFTTCLTVAGVSLAS